ncbi:hypothetical protein BDZ88DRAFT_442220 [Geranomyces variabilis]|nr:hypothetical protein BDZ88DRAFT_442220 [Geranomyces variabilis]
MPQIPETSAHRESPLPVKKEVLPELSHPDIWSTAKHEADDLFICPHEGCRNGFATAAAHSAHLTRCGVTILARDLPRHAFLCSAGPKPGRKRVALLVACADYAVSNSLANPLADARLLAAVLDGLGFAVTTVANPGREDAEDPSAIAVFAFSGHGKLDANGRNTLLLCDETKIDASMDVGSRLTESGPLFSVLVFDCCRASNGGSNTGGGRNSSSRSNSPARMLPMDFPATVVALSCGFGQRAVDGDGTTTCSPFARILTRVLSEEDAGKTDVRKIFERVARDLWVKVGQRATVVANLHEFGGGGGVEARLAE